MTASGQVAWREGQETSAQGSTDEWKLSASKEISKDAYQKATKFMNALGWKPKMTDKALTAATAQGTVPQQVDEMLDEAIQTESLLADAQRTMKKLEAKEDPKAEDLHQQLLVKVEDVRDEYRTVQKMKSTKKSSRGRPIHRARRGQGVGEVGTECGRHPRPDPADEACPQGQVGGADLRRTGARFLSGDRSQEAAE